MTNLFQAAGMGREAPRPLADRLRPQKLSDVVGQDHLVGSEGVITRMLAAGRIPSIILWGPPGTGKTTIARLLAGETGLAFEPRIWPRLLAYGLPLTGGGLASFALGTADRWLLAGALTPEALAH